MHFTYSLISLVNTVLVKEEISINIVLSGSFDLGTDKVYVQARHEMQLKRLLDFPPSNNTFINNYTRKANYIYIQS